MCDFVPDYIDERNEFQIQSIVVGLLLDYCESSHAAISVRMGVSECVFVCLCVCVMKHASTLDPGQESGNSFHAFGLEFSTPATNRREKKGKPVTYREKLKTEEHLERKNPNSVGHGKRNNVAGSNNYNNSLMCITTSIIVKG